MDPEIPPDFNMPAYQAIRQVLTNAGLTDEEAVQRLLEAWQNDAQLRQDERAARRAQQDQERQDREVRECVER